MNNDNNSLERRIVFFSIQNGQAPFPLGWGWLYSVENAGVSGDTTAQLLDRIEWVLAGDDITAIILTIGSNDAFQSKNPADIKANIVKILDRIEQRGIPVLLVGMKAPLNL